MHEVLIDLIKTFKKPFEQFLEHLAAFRVFRHWLTEAEEFISVKLLRVVAKLFVVMPLSVVAVLSGTVVGLLAAFTSFSLAWAASKDRRRKEIGETLIGYNLQPIFRPKDLHRRTVMKQLRHASQKRPHIQVADSGASLRYFPIWRAWFATKLRKRSR